MTDTSSTASMATPKRPESTGMEPRPITMVAAFLVLAVLVAGCGADPVDVDSSADPVPSATTSTEDVTSTTAEASTSTAAAPTTTASTRPPTTEAPDCDAECPLSADELAAVQEMLDAYNAADWEAFTASQRSDSPEWNSPVGFINNDYVRWDFIWSEAMSEIWTLGDCYGTDDGQTCRILIEDDLHRALELDPSDCRFWFDIAPDASGALTAKITEYVLEPCHRGYDSAMHAYGAWFERTYPGEEPIQGLHYRAWNQPDETAGERAAAHLDEYIASGAAGNSDH